MGKQINIKTSYQMLAKWGEPGAPLLPESVREAWVAEPLPNWAAAELGLPEGSTLASLGEGVLNSHRKASARFRNYLNWLITSRRRQINSLRVLAKTIPVDLNLERVPWKIRTRNCLKGAGLLSDLAKLGRVTFRDLYNIQAMGSLSILDFACTLEAAILDYQALEQSVAQLPDEMLATINEPWAEQVSERDPRFAHLFPIGEGTVLDRLDAFTSSPLFSGLFDKPQLIAAIQQSRIIVQELARLPLEVLLRQYLVSLSNMSGKRLEALIARFGWGGSPPITLEQTGLKLGITRERVRQLESKVKGRFPTHPVVMPALDRALELLQKRAPLNISEASTLLVKAGLASKPFHPESVLAAAQDCGRTPQFTVERIKNREMVIAIEKEGITQALLSIVRKQTGASGVSNIWEVVSQAEQKGFPIEREQARHLLQQHSDIQFLVDDWFWSPYLKPELNRLRNVTRKMLSVASPIEVHSLRDGIRRIYRWRNSSHMRSWELIIPPKNVLEAFYRAHPEFSVDDTGRVTSCELLDYKIELAQTEQIIVNVIRSSPACVLDRESFLKACQQRGINENTLSIHMTYSPVIEHLGIDLWTLRGVRVDPAAVEALRLARLQRPREKRLVNHGWTPRGTLWVGTRLPAVLNSLVVHIPTAIQRLLVAGEFQAESETGLSFGTVKVGANGSSWGYNPYLSQYGADEDDILIVEFDLIGKKATLRLGNDELLQEYSPDAA